MNDGVSEPLAKNFANSIIQQINSCLTLHAQEATEVLEALKGSAYAEPDKKRIMASLEAKIKTPHQAKTGGAMKEQVLRNPWAVCTASDWVVFRNPKISLHIKMTRLVERLNLIGCTAPNTQTQRWMLAMLLMVHYPEPLKPLEVYEKLQDLKAVVACEKKSFPFQHITTFPEHITDLPAEIIDYAYADGPPVVVDLPGIKTIADKKKMPLRSNNGVMKGDKSRHRTKSLTGIKEEQPPPPVERFAGSDMPRPDDPVECQLFTKYKSDLWRHRLTHTEPIAATHDQAEAPIKKDHGSLGMKMEADGSVTLCPRLGNVAIKKEQSPPLQNEQSDDDDARKIEQSGDGGTLDPWAQAALKAIGQRNAGKAAAAKGKQAAKAAAKAAAKKAGKPLKVAAKAKQAVKVKEQVHEVAKPDILKAMPKAGEEHPAAVNYNGGVIYTCVCQHKFRCLKVRGDNYSEISKAWGTKRTRQQAWKECIDAVDAHHACHQPKKGKAK